MDREVRTSRNPCTFCGLPGWVYHHWRELGSEQRYQAWACLSCNSILRRPMHDPERYLLPPLDVQKWYVGEVHAGRQPVNLAELVDRPDAREYYCGWVDIHLEGAMLAHIHALAAVDGIPVGKWVLQALGRVVAREEALVSKREVLT